jgi:hypothetical protein
MMTPQKGDHGLVDLCGPFLLNPMTAAREDDRFLEAGDEFRQASDELVHTAEGQQG